MIGDRWFDHNFSFVPNDEGDQNRRVVIEPHQLRRLTRFGCVFSISCVIWSNSKPSLERSPCFHSMTPIYCDSQASIKSIRTFLSQSGNQKIDFDPPLHQTASPDNLIICANDVPRLEMQRIFTFACPRSYQRGRSTQRRQSPMASTW